MGKLVFMWEKPVEIYRWNFYLYLIFAKKKSVSRKKQKPFYEGLKIEDIGSEGKAIAKTGEMVVFTSYAVPGDIVDLQVTKKRKRYAEANVTKFHKFSDDRTENFCEHFGICGGCKWQIFP